ncbi:MAG: transcription termination factor Rho [Actinomycetota bacterium]
MTDGHAAERGILAAKRVAELQAIAEQVGVRDARKLKKADLIEAIQRKVQESNGSPGGRDTGESPSMGETSAPSAARSPTVAENAFPPSSSASSPVDARSESAPSDATAGGQEPTTNGAPDRTQAAAPSPSQAGSGEGGGSAAGTEASTPPAQAPSEGGTGDAGGEGRQDGRRDFDGYRDRGRRRRRRERGDRGGDRNDRNERPRTYYEPEDTTDLEVRQGILDILPEGYGFVRTSGHLPGQEDVYVSLSQVRRFQLRRGDEIVGAVRRPKEGEKYQALVRIDSINQMAPDEIVGRPWFERLTPLYPMQRLRMELKERPNDITQRIVDLIAPIGKGQRGMIVSPPKAGKTTIMKQIANSITTNNPECHLIVLLVDERPEEVTDMQRSVNGEIVYSTFDRPSDDHIQVTELTLDRAKRLVELGKDVVILLDGITRLSRAYNLATPASGRILSGGVDSTALYPPKRFFGAARNIEEGGSLTVIATALVETGSRMDEVIFEEFKGTGNWELRLDRRASEKRVFPALDIEASGTRKEELLLTPDELALTWKLRRVLHALEGVAGLELLIDKMRQTKGNDQFLREVQKVPVGD